MIHRPWIIEARRRAGTDRRRNLRWKNWAPYFALATKAMADTRFENLDGELLAALEFRKAYSAAEQ